MKVTGFAIDWVLKNVDAKELAQNTETKTNAYDLLNLKEIRKIMHLVTHMRKQNMTEKRLSERLNTINKEVVQQATTYPRSSGDCIQDRILDSFTEDFLNPFYTEFGVTKDEKIIPDIMNTDIEYGFNLLLSLISCRKYMPEMSVFHKTLISTRNSPTIIQATVNNIQPDNTVDRQKTSIKKFYTKLEQIFKIYLGDTIMTTSSRSEIQEIMKKFNFLKNKTFKIV